MKVTKKMIGAAHDICLKKGDFVLSADLLERIYLAMDALANHDETSDSLNNRAPAAPFDENFPFGPEVFIEDKPAPEIKKGAVMKLDTVKLAKEAGLWVFITDQEPKLQHFTNLIIEECAKTCLRGDNEYSNGIECAKRIREMKSE